MSQTVARSLRQLRLERGMSLRDLAEACGISRGMLSLVERGLLLTTRQEADAIAAVLELPDGSLVTRTLLVLEELR